MEQHLGNGVVQYLGYKKSPPSPPPIGGGLGGPQVILFQVLAAKGYPHRHNSPRPLVTQKQTFLNHPQKNSFGSGPDREMQLCCPVFSWLRCCLIFKRACPESGRSLHVVANVFARRLSSQHPQSARLNTATIWSH
jgi:hypothetical protein